MKMARMLGILTLLWIDPVVNGEEQFHIFIRDVLSTFKLRSPTIIYDGDDVAPEICFTEDWTLCLPSYGPERGQAELIKHSESELISLKHLAILVRKA